MSTEKLGVSQKRDDAVGKVTGTALYPGDILPHELLHGKIVFSDRPHARMVSIDTAAARSAPGVVLVLTAADVPVNEYGLEIFDQPVLVGVDSNGRSTVPADISRWEADQVALIIAESIEQAEAACELLVIEWEDLPIVSTLDEALAGNILVRPEINSLNNVCCSYRLRKGNVTAGWDAAEVEIAGTYEVPYQEHAYLQPEAALGYIDDEGRITIEIAGQWTREDQEQIAHALDVPVDRVRVIYPAIGGAFGGREDMSMQIVLALAVWRLAEQGLQRPVRLQWSREESIVGHHKRHRGRIHARWGATRDGRIVVAEADCVLDAGAYYYTTRTVLGHLHLTVSGPYDIPNLRVDSDAVFTNAVPGGAFRGFGAPQGLFVAETQINKLAALLAIDPVEIRRLNCLKEGSIGATGTVLPAGVSLPTVIDRCAEEARWLEPMVPKEAFSACASLPPERQSLRRGRGFACAFKNVGFSLGFPERCEARIVLHGFDKVERVDLFSGAADVGQGSDTVLRQMTAEAVGVSIDCVKATFADTATGGDSGSTSASRMTFMGGNAILGACQEAKERWAKGERPAVGWFRFVPPPTDPLNDTDSRGTPYFAYGYGADAVDLSVDIDTGHIMVHDVVCTVDVGRAINPAMIVGQIEGGVVQGHGYAVTEDLQVHGARIVNPRLSTYLIPGILDVPERVHSVILEEPDPRGPWGVRGMAEVPLIPYAPAVVAALYDATGVWFDQIPLTPERVRAHLRARGVSPDVPRH